MEWKKIAARLFSGVSPVDGISLLALVPSGGGGPLLEVQGMLFCVSCQDFCYTCLNKNFWQCWYTYQARMNEAPGFPLRTGFNGLWVDPWVDQELLTKMATKGLVAPDMDPNGANVVMIIEKVVGVCFCPLMTVVWIDSIIKYNWHLYWYFFWGQHVPNQSTGYQFTHITRTSTCWVQKRMYNQCNRCQYQFWHACTGIGGPHWHWHLDIQPNNGSHIYGVNAIDMVAVNIPIKCFEVQDVRPVKGQFHMNITTIWKLIPGEPNGNVLKFLSAKGLIGFKKCLQEC